MLKKLFSLLLCTLSAGTFLFAQSADGKEVEGRVESLRMAMIGADTTGLAALTADELSYGHSSGLVENKSAFIDQFITGKTIFKTISLSEQTIKVSGDVAIARHRLTGDTYNNNLPGKVDILILMVWQKQKGEWKLLARQAAKLPVAP
ncbi:MAG: nuclear transport factor 2 family protein [Ferruginibacter sp.]